MAGIAPQRKSDHIIYQLNKMRGADSINDLALVRLKREIDSIPEYFERYHCLGIYYQFKGDLDKVIGNFEKALKINPNDNLVLNNYMRALMLMDRQDLAYEYAVTLLKRDDLECSDLLSCLNVTSNCLDAEHSKVATDKIFNMYKNQQSKLEEGKDLFIMSEKVQIGVANSDIPQSRLIELARGILKLFATNSYEVNSVNLNNNSDGLSNWISYSFYMVKGTDLSAARDALCNYFIDHAEPHEWESLSVHVY